MLTYDPRRLFPRQFPPSFHAIFPPAVIYHRRGSSGDAKIQWDPRQSNGIQYSRIAGPRSRGFTAWWLVKLIDGSLENIGQRIMT